MSTSRTDFDVTTRRLQNQVISRGVVATPQTIVFTNKIASHKQFVYS